MKYEWFEPFVSRSTGPHQNPVRSVLNPVRDEEANSESLGNLPNNTQLVVCICFLGLL